MSPKTGGFDERDNYHSLQKLTQRTKASIAAVGERMVLHPESRVTKWVTLLDALEHADRREVLATLAESLKSGNWRHPYRPHLRALVEVRSFVEVVEQLLPDLSNSDLRDLVSGTLDPADERMESRARDREFELYVAAVCKRAGLQPSLIEPDVICITERGKRALAAKRLSSPSRVRANVKKARMQIEQCEEVGFAILDVTRILEPHYDHMLHWKIGDGSIQRALQALQKKERQDAFDLSGDIQMKGVILRMVFPLISPRLRLGTYESWSVASAAPGGAIEVNSFLETFLSGLEGI